MADLLDELREPGAGEEVTELLARALEGPDVVADLLRALREAGAHEQAEVLMGQLPGAGMFQLFYEQEGHQERFRFGRDADGSPARQWGWEDLD